MKKKIVMNTKKAMVAALFFGAVSFGFAQETTATTPTIGTATAQVVTPQQNPEIDALKKQVEANPKDTDAIVKLATAYQDAKDWTSALATWNQMSMLLPEWAPSYYSLGYVYQNMKDDANAKAMYEKYIAAVKPTELEANKKNLAYAHFFIAYQLQETDKEQAKMHIAKSLEYDPMNADAIKVSEFINK